MLRKTIANIRLIKMFLSLFWNNPKILFQNIYYNYLSKQVKRGNGDNCYILIYPHCKIELQTGAEIDLNASLYLGKPTIKGGTRESRLLMRKDSIFEVNGPVEFSDGFDIQIQKEGKLILDKFHSNIDLEISCGARIQTCGEVFCGRHVRIKDFNGHLVSSEVYPFKAPIKIENHVWICTGSTINPGCVIGSGSVISDNSNVINDVPQNVLVQGNPAKIIDYNIKFKI